MILLNCLICFVGDVLITVATGFLTDSEGERAGLVPTHAYAVLDIRKIKVLYLYELLARQFDTVLYLIYSNNYLQYRVSQNIVPCLCGYVEEL